MLAIVQRFVKLTYMAATDRAKLIRLNDSWARHERWVQAGCPDAPTHTVDVPGYAALSHSAHAYAVYRNSFVPFFNQFDKLPNLAEDLRTRVNELRRSHPDAMTMLLKQYEARTETFDVQWGNLFHANSGTLLSHESLAAYQRKYEVELPLRFLSHIASIRDAGTFDPALTSFLDSRRGLRKGLLLRHIRDSFPAGTPLGDGIRAAYNAELRNAIAHNAYSLTENRVKGLDTALDIAAEVFVDHMIALHEVQNAVIWLLSVESEDTTGLEGTGVVGIGWAATEDGAPVLSIFQLEPIAKLDLAASWLRQVSVTIKDGVVHTQLGCGDTISGPLTPELESLLAASARSGTASCLVIPVMPCVHSHEPDLLIEGHGEFCGPADNPELCVPMSVHR